MDDLFLQILNMSLSAAWLVPVVLLLRLCLKKAPKWIHCLLWALVAVRLVIPFFPESPVSLLPSGSLLHADRAAVQTGIPAINQAVNPVLAEASPARLDTLYGVVCILWLAGVMAMLVYSLISWLRLRRQVQVSVRFGAVYLCDDIDTPFILGVFRPRIYIPSGMTQEQMRHVCAHEQAHLRRRDHWWKPLGYFLLAVHWFNPLVWLGYILLCRDIEKACDEKVIRDMDGASRKSYSEALLSCSLHRRAVLACPLAFGELAVKERIRGVLSYKKPVIWLITAAVALCLVMSACFLTNPVSCLHTYRVETTRAATCTHEGTRTYTCTRCYDVYTKPVEMCLHRYDEGHVELHPTCTTWGLTTFTCLDCGGQIQKETAPAAHAWGAPFETAPVSCTQTGLTVVECGACREQHVVSPALQTEPHHTMVTQVVTPATCTAEGTGVSTCSACGYKEDCTFPKTEHRYVETARTTGTCLISGYCTMTCTGCGTWYTYDLGCADHNWKYYNSSKKRCASCGWIIPSSVYTFTGNHSSGSTDVQWPVIKWAPEAGDPPGDFSWLYP